MSSNQPNQSLQGTEPRHGWETLFWRAETSCTEVSKPSAVKSWCFPAVAQVTVSNSNQLILFSVGTSDIATNQQGFFWEPVTHFASHFSSGCTNGWLSLSEDLTRSLNLLHINMTSKLKECVLQSRLSTLSFQETVLPCLEPSYRDILKPLLNFSFPIFSTTGIFCKSQFKGNPHTHLLNLLSIHPYTDPFEYWISTMQSFCTTWTTSYP